MSKLNLSFELVEEDSILNLHSAICLQVYMVTTKLKDHNQKKVKFLRHGHQKISSVLLGAVLQIGRSLVRFQMVSLEFFIDIILPIVLWPWGRLSL